jgi:two-component system cell cycle sensor histidine kinase/response regulator CckA
MSGLDDSAGRDRQMMDAAAVPIFEILPDGRYSYANEALAVALGTTVKGIVGTRPADHYPKDEADARIAVMTEVFRTGREALFESRVPRLDGDRVFRSVLRPMRDDSGQVASAVGTVWDITDHARAEEALRRSQALLDATNRMAKVGGWRLDLRTQVLTWTREVYRIHDVDESYDLTLAAGIDFYTPESQPVIASAVQRAIAHGEDFDLQLEIISAIGARRWVRAIGTSRSEDGKAVELTGTFQDITDQRRAHDEVLKSRALLDDAQRLAKIGGWTFDVATLCQTWTDETFRILEIETTDGPPKVPEGLNFFTPEWQPVVAEALERAIEDGVPYDLECEITTTQGNRRWVKALAKVHRENGCTTSLSGSFQDITERKKAEQARAALEGQLRQAQKLESIGRLAGGIAHDFNNMLAVILGNVDLALGRVDPAGEVRYDLEEIRVAARRSADLTQQLLAFARKQLISPKVVDLNASISGLFTLLRRLIGEHIRLTWTPGPNLWSVRVDQAQFDQVLVNLCANARDSIADIGTITLETRNRVVDEGANAESPWCPPGAYVEISVRDDGCGMDEETRSNAFEPFFTTKGVGKGTGLGLAMVYGVTQQNHGFVSINSAPGAGTTVTILLPRHSENVEEPASTGAVESPERGTETILLVEDQPAVLDVTKRLLESRGYTVYAASTPTEAIRLANEHSRAIDLLLTDVLMPEMNGVDLARTLASSHPTLRCLLMSGNLRDAPTEQGFVGGRAHFLQKPFSLEELTAAVRAALTAEKR